MLNVMNAEGVQLQAKLFRGFGDPARLNILQALRNGPMTVTEIVAATCMSQSNTSNHLRCLRECGLVAAEQQGKFALYRLSDDLVGCRRRDRSLDRDQMVWSKVASIRSCPLAHSP